jgi:hypothetical protein
MNNLSNEVSRPLSGIEIKQHIPNCVIITYPDLYKYDSIQEIFDQNRTDCIIMLYETAPNYGHWTMLMDRPDRITFFDAYNNEPDEQFNFISEEFKNQNDMDNGYLLQLLLDSDKEIHYNNHRLQSKSKHIATCGRHCIVRYKYKNLDDDTYYDMMDYVAENTDFTTDEIVTIKTIV